MRKIILFFLVSLFLSLLTTSCEQDDYIYNIILNNNSDYDISFYFNGQLETLEAKTSREYGRYDRYAVTDIRADNDIYGLKITTNNRLSNNNSDLIYTISNRLVYKLNVTNTLDADVIIIADNYIDNNGSTELTVLANSNVSDINIYTNNPNFTIICEEIPVNIILNNWTFDSDNKTIILFLR